MSGQRVAALDTALLFRDETVPESKTHQKVKNEQRSAPKGTLEPIKPKPKISFWKRLSSKVNGTIGLDLGSQNTVIYTDADGVILNEPSIVAVRDGKIVASGHEAKKMVGRTPKGTNAVYPLQKGVIADFDLAKEMMKIFLKKARAAPFSAGQVAVAIPAGVTEVDRRALDEAVVQSGPSKAFLVDENLAAAVGAGIDVESPEGRFVVSLGAGTTQAAVISLGQIVHSEVSFSAGTAIDQTIIKYLEMEHQFLIGAQTAEEVKIALAGASEEKETRGMIVHGRSSNGPPSAITITSNDIFGAIAPRIEEISATIMAALEAAPPELAGDIVRGGIVLTGGTALIRGLAQRISRDTGLSVRIAKHPLDVVAVGAYKFALRNVDFSSGN